jgi:ubiquinone/menaquinone biosynthesis C-methylase UbiE
VARQEKYGDKNPVVSFVIGRFFERLRGVVAGLKPGTLLDAGCGEGELLRRGVLPEGLRPVCLDLRADSLAEIAEPKRVRASVQALPFSDRSFDVVTCLEVLEHLEDPGSAVRDLARVAKKAIVLSVPFEPWFRAGNVLRGKHLAALGNHPEHMQHWNLRTFETFLSASVAEVRIVEAFPWIIACCRPNQR